MGNSGQRIANRRESQANGQNDGSDGDSRFDFRSESSDLQESRLARERAAVFERVLSSVSHALGTPLQVISGRAAMIRMDAPDEDIREHARIVERKVQDITQLMQRLLEFARGSDFDARACDLADVTNEAIELARPSAAARHITLDVSLEEAPCVALREVALLMVTDLLTEAVQRSRDGSTLTVSVRARTEETSGAPRPCADLSIRADRDVFDEAVLDRAHEPWMKADPGDRDSALRIVVSFGVLRRIGGWSRVQAVEDGTTLSFCVPAN